MFDEFIRGDAPSMTRTLNDAPQRRLEDVQAEVCPQHAFPTDHSKFNARACVGERNQRNECRCRKVDLVGQFIALANEFRQRELYGAAGTQETAAILFRERS